MKEIIMDGETIINATDWKQKSEYIIAELDKSLFNGIREEDTYDIKYDKDGNELSRKKKNVKKNEIMPLVSPAQVTTKLNRLLRVYRPMTKNEAMTLADTDYLEAYGYYLDIVSHINTYTTFLGDKQTFSAFCNITTDIYNELLMEDRYSRVFNSIEDGFVQTNFTVAQAGLVDGKTTVAKLQTKDAGHSLRKADETIVYNINNGINKEQVNLMLERFTAMTKQIGSGKK